MTPTLTRSLSTLSLWIPPVVPADRPQDVQARWHGWFTHVLDQQGYRNPPLLTTTQPSAQRDFYETFDIVEHLPPYLRSGFDIDLRNRWNHISDDEGTLTMDGHFVILFHDELRPQPVRSLLWPPYFNEFPVLIDFNLFGLAYAWFLTQHERVPPLAVCRNDLTAWHPHNFLHTAASTMTRQFHHIQPLRPSRIFQEYHGRYATWSDLRRLIIDQVQISWDIDLAPVDIHMYLDLGQPQPIEPVDDDTWAWIFLGHFPIWPQLTPLTVFVIVSAGVTPFLNIPREP